jgi:error-prone DNA polymerase
MAAFPPFCELAAASNFSFLEGASHPEELVARAKALGMHAIGIADRHTMAGIVRAHVAAREHGIALAVGTRAEFALGADDEPSHVELVLLAESPEGYARLCRLLTLGKRRTGWTLDVDGSPAALMAGIEGRGAARDATACRLWLHDLVDASVQALGMGEPGGAPGARSPDAARPLAPFALGGVHAIVMPPAGYGAMQPRFLECLRWLRGAFDGDRLSLGFVHRPGPDAALRLLQLEWLSSEAGVPLLATNDPRCHDPARRPLQDVLTAIRARRTVDELRHLARTAAVDAAHGCAWDGPSLAPGGAACLEGAAGVARVLEGVPEDVRAAAMARAAEVAARCAGFSMSMLRYRYPAESVPPGRTPDAHLRALVEAGAATRWPGDGGGGVPARVRAQLEHELAIIADLGYAPYFLTVHGIVAFARGRGILCQGRGAAANSATCYCLGITAVDPTRSEMLFERFISRERDEPPDIDVDFEHERREEVIQHVYATYGRARAALCAEVACYRGRSAIRDVGRALGMPDDLVGLLAGAADWWGEAEGIEGLRERVRDGGTHGPRLDRLRELGLDPGDPGLRRLFALAGDLLGFPRHLSQHVGGFVVTDGPLCELVPVRNAAMEDRTVIEWDKDDVEAMGMLKVDVLALGMLTAIRKAIDLANAHPAPGVPHPLEYRTVPPEDPATYEMVSRADTVGVFQVESRAQMSMLPRLRPRCFYDLVIEVAIVRPGPIQGDMVHPYLRRRDGIDPFTYPDDAVRAVLGRTLGVPLFQEQAMALAVVAAGFTPGEADRLRRAIAAWRRSGNQIAQFGEHLERGMLARGYTLAFAQQVFRQIQGFSGYGFPESHAASFALLVYVSAWLKRHHPAAFLAALLNSQPMGFYAPAQLVRDARAHGVEVCAVDVLRSAWDCTLEDRAGAMPAVRLGLRMVSGLAEHDGRSVAEAMVAMRTARGGAGEGAGDPPGIERLWRASGCGVRALRCLAAADAFAGIGVDRQQALWQVRALRERPEPVLEAAAGGGATLFDCVPQPLPPVGALRAVAADYASTGLSLRAHPISFLRESLARRGAVECARLAGFRTAMVGGLVLCRQRPATASGIVFMTLEDESGVANLIIRPRAWERCRRIGRHAGAILAEGRVEHRDGVTHLLVRRMADLGPELARRADGTAPAQRSRDFR